MAKTSIGVYISSEYVDVAELSGSKNSARIEHLIREEIKSEPPKPSDKPEDEQILLKNAIVQALKKSLLQVKSNSSSINISLSSTDVMIRYFDMPQLPRSEQNQAIRFEARKYVPFKLDEIMSDFKVLPPAKGKKMMEVFFIAAAKDKINSYVELCKAGGTQAGGVDIVPFALMRIILLCKLAKPKDNICLLYVDNDKKSAFIHIMESGMPFLTRDLKIDVNDKDSLFEKLASELRISVDYYNRYKLDKEVSKIVMCGEHLFEGLDAYLADELKIVAETLDDMPGLKDAKRGASSAVVAIGTALGGLGRSTYSVNLSPVAKAIKKKQINNVIVVEAIASVFIIIGAIILSGIQISNRGLKLDSIVKEGSNLPAPTSGLDSKTLDVFKRKSLKELNFLILMVNSRVSWAQKLDRIVKNIPDSCWISDLSAIKEFTRGKIGYPTAVAHDLQISGRSFVVDRARQAEHIKAFLATLKKDEAFMANFQDIGLGEIEPRQVRDYWISYFNVSTQREKSEAKIEKKQTSKW
ncbi:pilus assembly protein PilM [Candidatus Omnitrophota bacterium]